MAKLKKQLFAEYEYSNSVNKNFYERYMKGENIKAGWVEKTDFEKNRRVGRGHAV
jgi:N-sulfoglucosamine sulfohydrolase